jgi:hypothetical protein
MENKKNIEEKNREFLEKFTDKLILNEKHDITMFLELDNPAKVFFYRQVKEMLKRKKGKEETNEFGKTVREAICEMYDKIIDAYIKNECNKEDNCIKFLGKLNEDIVKKIESRIKGNNIDPAMSIFL